MSRFSGQWFVVGPKFPPGVTGAPVSAGRVGGWVVGDRGAAGS